MTGLFVTFEGGEGSGKTTQVDRLAYTLIQAGLPVTVTREPGSGELGAKIRAMLLNSPAGSVPARAEALLYAADRANHVHTVVYPALARGHVVLCDRYQDSSIAYQGFARRLGPGPIAWLSEWATDHLHPDLVVLLDIDPADGLDRAGRRGGTADRIEQETLAFHEHVRSGFLARAHTNPGGYLVLDASDSVDVLAAVIAARVCGLIERRARRRDLVPAANVIAMSDRSRT